MCGITVTVRKGNKKGNIAKRIIKRYEAQKTRGSQGFGFVAVKDSVLSGYERSADEKTIYAKIKEHKMADLLFFHHRFPTSTPNVPDAAHPIFVSHPSLKHDYFVQHNGVISNHSALKKVHDTLGFVYTTELEKAVIGKTYTFSEYVYNDSEALAIELARYFEGQSKTIDAIGSIAFVALEMEKGTNKITKMRYGRNTGNPLTLSDSDNYMTLASEGGKISLTPNVLYTLDLVTNTESTQECKVGTYFDYSNGYKNTGYTYPTPRKKEAMGFVGHDSYSYDVDDFYYGEDLFEDADYDIDNPRYWTLAEERAQLMVAIETEVSTGLYEGELDEQLNEIESEMMEIEEEYERERKLELALSGKEL